MALKKHRLDFDDYPDSDPYQKLLDLDYDPDAGIFTRDSCTGRYC